MATYWKAETYEHGELADIDFPGRLTRQEAIGDAADALSSCSEAELEYTTAAIEEWTADDDGGATNNGKAQQIDRNGKEVVT